MISIPLPLCDCLYPRTGRPLTLAQARRFAERVHVEAVGRQGALHRSGGWLWCAKNGRVLVHVIDNGEGVPDDYKDGIFAKFVQAPDTKRSLRKGTGLGLAFCRLVVQAHGG
ncbi:Alginate biosynthesis sensor protein KinB [Thermoflexales bacterium]|nr:Alginate biosynthesis sensor protein KinB [Thermoflexales bacterium]